MNTLRFLVVQIDKNATRLGNTTRVGVLVPINADGFYRDREDAEDIAEFMAEECPELETYVVEVARMVQR